MGKYYAVAIGRKQGVYTSWEECEEQVKGFSKPVYRKFANEAAAAAFIKRTTDELLGPHRPEDTNSYYGEHVHMEKGSRSGQVAEPMTVQLGCFPTQGSPPLSMVAASSSDGNIQAPCVHCQRKDMEILLLKLELQRAQGH